MESRTLIRFTSGLIINNYIFNFKENFSIPNTQTMPPKNKNKNKDADPSKKNEAEDAEAETTQATIEG